MDVLSAWNNLTWLDGVLFSIWIGGMYYGKCWIDYKFRKNT